MAVHLTKQTFLEKVFNYEKNKEWKFEGELPAVILGQAGEHTLASVVRPQVLDQRQPGPQHAPLDVNRGARVHRSSPSLPGVPAFAGAHARRPADGLPP